MDSARPRRMPGWIVLVRENFSVNKRVCRKQTIEIVLRGVCLFSFSNFTFGFHGFHLKKLKLIQLIFDLVPGIYWLTIKTIECLCLGTIGLIVAPWKFDVLKTSVFALEASLLGQIFVLRTSNFRGATISR